MQRLLKDGLKTMAAAMTMAVGLTTTWAAPGSTQPGDTLTLNLTTQPATAPAAGGTLRLDGPVPATQAPAAPVAPAAAGNTGVTAQAFVGTIVRDRVNVRSGAGVNFYELGQLSRGDTVQVVGSKNGWYAIDPPAGVYCYVVKELVDVEAGGQSGTIKGEFVNVRAASALHPASDYAVLTIAKKGTKVTILGSADKYYKIAPPDGAHVYVSGQFVIAAAAGTAYSTPTLQLPAGLPPPSTAPAIVDNGGDSTRPGESITVVVKPQPATNFNTESRSSFAALNERTQAEFVKPILKEDLAGLLEEYKTLLKIADLPPSVQQGSEARVAIIEKRIELQNIARAAESPESNAATEERKALERTWQDSQKQIADAELNAPYVAEGVLMTSEALKSKYVLVNPTTQRVVAYVDPTSEIDVSPLLGHYIGVKGKVEQTDGIKLVHAKTATLMKTPEQ